MYTDVHCHLLPSYYPDPDAALQECLAAKVDLMIASGFDISSSADCASLSEKHAALFYSAGWQPQELDKLTDESLADLAALCKGKKCVALGEIGLDYHYPDNPPKERQQRLLVRQLELAYSLSLPVVIHSRDCAEDMLRVLKENKAKLAFGGVMHCYSHSAELVKDFLSLGLYFSFGGTSTYKNAKKVAASARAVPQEKILSETDSPYLPPEPKRGQYPNTPANIPYIVKNLATLRGEGEEELALAIRQNALALFPKIPR